MEEEKKQRTTVASTLADPQFKAGRKLIDSNRLDEAVDFFSGLLETRVQVLGDELSPALAPLYYEYGNALLYSAEESDVMFGDAITDAEKNKAMALLEAQAAEKLAQKLQELGGADAGAGAPAGQAGEGGDASAGGGGAEEDLEIAWENLEMARRIYEKLEVTDEIRSLLGKVHLRLGDLNMVNGMYNEAAEEFGKCLAHRTALPDPVSRGVADAHVRRAQALFYASTLEGADKDRMVASSLEQYRSAAGIFEAMLAALKTKTPMEQSPGKENSNGEQQPSPVATAATMKATISNSSAAAENGAESGETNGKGKAKAKAKEEQTPETTTTITTLSPTVSSSNGGAKTSMSTTATATDKDSATPHIVPGSAEDLQDVLDTILETIETMVSGKDMEALAEYKSGAVSTTTGFGKPSLPSSSAGAGAGAGAGGAALGGGGEVTTIGFGAQTQTGFGSASHSGAAAGAAMTSAGPNMMVVKRKGRPTPKAVAPGAGSVDRVAGADGAAAAAGAAASDGQGDSDEPAKRAKNNV